MNSTLRQIRELKAKVIPRRKVVVGFSLDDGIIQVGGECISETVFFERFPETEYEHVIVSWLKPDPVKI